MTEASVFTEALDKATDEERAAYLAQACAGDERLRRRVEALLRAHAEPDDILDPAAAQVATVDEAPMTERPGSRVGAYKLMEQIGEGGFGLVFVAEQTEPVRRKVALKVIKPGMDSRQVIARFEAERQALALMEHPNIAKVLEAGTTDSGRPYFVMELVRGIPITEYCDQNQLTPRERLEVFVSVCQAIQHAHQKGIIHRDVKPSNVLVTSHDGKPVAKVIDFGVAKAIHQQLTDRTIYTQFAQMIGTPLYMSPEQAEMSGLDIDTRSDIYSLGVLLYELLTGTTPLQRKRFAKAAYDEIRRLIREEEPPKPSQRLSTSDTLPSIAACRKMEPAKLSRMMRGELDWIVMKALEKDRTRRYETASGLARDVQRYLADELVEARPPSAGYRLGKFARKHRTALTTAATIVLLLVAGVAVSTWQAVRAKRAEWQTIQERDRAIQSEQEARLLQTKAQLEEQKALKSAAEAIAMISFFKDLMLEARQTIFAQDDIHGGVPGTGPKKLRNKRMDEAVAIIDSEKVRTLFADYPLAEAEIREWIATQAFPTEGEYAVNFLSLHSVAMTSLHAMGDGTSFVIRYDPHTARRHLERALELRSVHLGPNDVKTLETMRKLGKTISSVDAGKGLQVLSDVLARSNAAFGPDHDQTLRYLDSLAAAYEVAEKPDDAVRVWKDVYTRTKIRSGEDSDEALNRSDSLAAAYEKAGRIEEALRQREESLRGRRKRAAGSFDPSVGSALQEVARLYDQMQEYTRAEPIWREALQFVKDNEYVRASLGLCLLKAGKPADAEPVLRECLAIREKKERDIWTTFDTKSMLGAALLGQRKYADAEPLLLAGYEGMKKAPGQNAAEMQGRLNDSLERLVKLYDAWGKPDEATKWRKELEAARAKKP